MDSPQPIAQGAAARRSAPHLRGADLLAAIVESSDDAILTKDLHGIILSWNPAAERIFGYSASEALDRHISILAPPGLSDPAAGPRNRQFDTVRRRKDGTLVEVSVALSPLLDPAGRLAGSVEIARDITGRRAAEERFRGVFDAAAEGIALTDEKGVVTLVNARFADLLGYTPDEMIGMRNVDLVHPDEVHRVVAAMRRRLTGDGSVREYRLLRRDGGIVWVSATGAPLRDANGAVTGVMVMVTDVTARHRAEEQISRVLESIADGFVAVDREWRFTYVNAAAERINQRPRDSMLGLSVWDVFPAAVGTQIEHEFRRAVADRTVTEFEHYYPPFERWFRIRCYPSPEGGLSVYFLDITDARHAAEINQRLADEARAGAERLRAIVQATAAVIWTTDAVGRFVTPQPSWEAYTGQVWPEYDRVGAIAMIHPDDRDRVRAEWPAIIAAGQPYEREMRLWHAATREFRHTVSRGVPLRNPEGTIREWVGVFDDVHERRLAEESLSRYTLALRESEDHYRNTVELNPQIPWTGRPDGSLEDVSPQWLELTGMTREHAVTGGYTEALHPDDLPRMMDTIAASLRTGDPLDIEHRVRVADGTYRWMRTRARPRRDAEGRIIRWYGNTEDIDARKRAEEELRASNEKLGKFLEACPLAVMALDTKGVVNLWSAAAEKLYGLSAEEVVGQFLPCIDEEERPEFLHSLEQVFSGAPLLGAETTCRRRTGPFDAQVWAVPFTLPDGQKQCLSIVAEVTERKRAEERYRETQKLESLGVLAGGIAHDFNNLLVGILGNASLAADSMPPAHPSRSRLEDVIGASERAADLTRQLLAYAGKGKFVIQPVDLTAAISEIATLIQTSIPKNVRLRLDLHPNPPAIEADRSQIQQLVMNLIINAAEAVGENHGAVLVSTGLQEIDEQYLRTVSLAHDLAPGPHVFFEVQDTGCGMPAETIARIFDPFFTTKFMGRGLGLSAALGIVRSHRGGMKVHSQPDKGSTFRALFPARPEPAAVPEPADEVETLTGAGMILVVDDEEIVRRTVRASLHRYGYSVLLAENGQAGIELFRVAHTRIGAVVLDMTMPVMSGEEALRQLQAIDASVPVILSTGFSEAEAVRRFTGKGLAGFLQKPFTARALAAKLKQVRERPSAL